jgi:hypothetical protein
MIASIVSWRPERRPVWVMPVSQRDDLVRVLAIAVHEQVAAVLVQRRRHSVRPGNAGSERSKDAMTS